MSDCISREAAIKELLDTYEREFPTADGAFDLFAGESCQEYCATFQPPMWSRCAWGSGNGALKIGGSRLRATNALRAGLSITERGFAAFITAPTAAQKWI